MCIALPMSIVAVVDFEACLVAVEPWHGSAADRGGREEVSAALIAEGASELAALVGRWGVVHAGFLMGTIEEDDALERLAVFAAMDAAAGVSTLVEGDDDRATAANPTRDRGERPLWS